MAKPSSDGLTMKLFKERPTLKNRMLFTEVAFVGRHIADCAVPMYTVVPVDKVSDPVLCGGDIRER